MKNPYDLGEVAKWLNPRRKKPRFTREFVKSKDGEPAGYDLSRIRVKKNW